MDISLDVTERIARPHFVPVVAQSKAYDPTGAVAAGFLDDVVPSGESEAAAISAAGELSRLPAEAYAKNKLARRARSLDVMKRDLDG